MIDAKLLKKYYDEGWSSESIAVEFDTDASTISSTCLRLRKQGILGERSQGFKPIDYSPSLRAEAREKKIISMRKAGYTNAQIATEIEVQLQTVKNLVRRLIREGKLEKRKPDTRISNKSGPATKRKLGR